MVWYWNIYNSSKQIKWHHINLAIFMVQITHIAMAVWNAQEDNGRCDSNVRFVKGRTYGPLALRLIDLHRMHTQTDCL